ncbi:MAG: BtpA/SgcQ family protein [Candidatus Dormiibacterota bacterium]
MSALLKDLFGTEKPVIAMAHLGALPGTPLYDAAGGVERLVDAGHRDLRALLEGGVDGVLFCNEGDRPYTLRAPLEAVATMSRVIAELRPGDRPFGVDFLWDPMAAMAMAVATGASFMREVLTGVYESDMGVWAPDVAAVLRYRRAIGGDGVRVFANITPEFASPLGSRTAAERARSAVTSSLVDAILIAGPRAGAAPEREVLARVREELRGDVPVLLNTGARVETIASFLEVADGVIVGSGLKVNGYTWNPVDPARVRAFMDTVRATRTGHA